MSMSLTTGRGEHIVEVPVPMTQEEIVHVPAVVNNHRHHHVEQEMIVDVHFPHKKEKSSSLALASFY